MGDEQLDRRIMNGRIQWSEAISLYHNPMEIKIRVITNMSQLIHSLYKHKVYKHAEPQIWSRQNEKT